jgi:hypothetical protein
LVSVERSNPTIENNNLASRKSGQERKAPFKELRTEQKPSCSFSWESSCPCQQMAEMGWNFPIVLYPGGRIVPLHWRAQLCGLLLLQRCLFVSEGSCVGSIESKTKRSLDRGE